MIKRALLLTAATVALLSGQANAATCDSSSTPTLCEINTVVVTPIATSTVQTGGSNISIIAPGGITVSNASATAISPALKIDSDNFVTNLSQTISNKNTPFGVGVEINAGQSASDTTTVGTYSGLLDTIDLTGTGTTKTGVLVDLPSTIAAGTLDTTTATSPGLTLGTISVVGDNSYGLHILSGVTVKGPVQFDGAVTVKSSTTTAGNSTGVVGAEVDGNLIGNLVVGQLGGLVATGAGSRGLIVLGSVTGNIFNGGAIEAVGASASSTTTPSTTGNPQGGVAFELAGSVSDGIYNAGSISPGDGIGRGTISTQGGGPALFISSTAGAVAAPLNIGVYLEATANGGFSFYNRGQISASPPNVNVGSLAMHVVGANAAPVTFGGSGMFNSGFISANAGSDASATSGISSTALWIDNFVTVPSLVNSNLSGSNSIGNCSSGVSGSICASVSGASPGQAVAIRIDSNANGHGVLNTLINTGTIAASATSQDTKVAFLNAIAIDDLSGTLSTITNSGLIEATTTTLDSNGQVRIAANLQANTSGVTFQNTGSVIGDVFFGSGNDTLHVSGIINAPAVVLGDIRFNGTTSGADTLTIDNYSTVSGAVLESGGGYVNTTVGTGGSGSSLFVNNTNFGGNTAYDKGSFEVGALDVKTGATLGVSLSQGFNQSASASNAALISGVNAGSNAHIHLEAGSSFDVTFGSFVSTPGGNPAKFTLLDVTSLGTIVIDDQSSIQTSIESSIPFLFSGTVCQYNLVGVIAACSGTQSNTQLVLNLTPKTVGTGAGQIPLTGYAAQIFPYANAALSNDNNLGSAVIAAGSGLSPLNATDVAKGNKLYQDLYAQFAPDVTGGGRAIAVSLTDEATSVLGAHQRELRMYAGQNASATLWGQEFVQRLDSGTNTPNGYRDSGFGFALGADGGSPSSGRYGAAFTFFSGDVLEKIPAQIKTNTEWYMFSGYTDWRGKGLFFDSQVTVGYGSLTGMRSIFVDNPSGSLIMSRTATNQRSALLAAGGFSTGEVMNMGTLVFMPQFSMDALTMRENGYTETGGGDGVDLTVAPYYAQSLRTYVGATLREDLKLGGFFLQPEARVGYRYDLLADPVHLRTMFAADKTTAVAAGTPFTLIGPDPAKGNVVLGAGIAATTGDWSLGVNYDLLSGSGATQHTGTLTLIGRL